MWLPYKGKWNQIEELLERYMKDNFIPLNGENKLLVFSELMFGNYLL